MSSLVPFNRRRLMGSGPVDYSGMPLTLIPLETGTLSIRIPSVVTPTNLEVLRYSLDGGANWTDIQITNADNSVSIQNVPAGSKVQFRGYGMATANQSGDIRLMFNTRFIVQGNIMSLLFDDNFANQYSLQSKASYTFRDLFYEANMLISAKNLILPATTLRTECYNSMFRLCERLTEAPELPAMTVPSFAYGTMFANCYALRKAPALPAINLSAGSYSWMFSQCYNLTEAPELPATTLPDSNLQPQSGVYESMFQNCTSLVNAPALPATTLGEDCYKYMFAQCTSLVNAPALPATTLKSECYSRMFQGCTALTASPDLLAPTLVSYCYRSMFDGCSNLSSIKMLATNISASNCLTEWVQNVAASGTFYKDANMTTLPTGINGIPDGWTVIDV